MAHFTFDLDVAAFEACIRNVVQPCHINMLPVDFHHFPQFFLPPQGDAKRADADEYTQVLTCVMVEDGYGLATFRDCEHYRMPENKSEEWDVPEDYSDEESTDDDDE